MLNFWQFALCKTHRRFREYLDLFEFFYKFKECRKDLEEVILNYDHFSKNFIVRTMIALFDVYEKHREKIAPAFGFHEGFLYEELEGRVSFWRGVVDDPVFSSWYCPKQYHII